MGDFEKILPDEVSSFAVRSGQELVLPFDQAEGAVRIASEHLIAVLGVEVFRIQNDGLGVVTYSGYAFEMTAWREFVRLSNEAALRFLSENTLGDGYGYILTTTSENEFLSNARKGQ
jgi:hypothetical protein